MKIGNTRILGALQADVMQKVFETTVQAYDSYTKLQLSFDGSDGSTNILDDTGKAVTVNGDAKIVKKTYKVGTNAIRFDGSDDYLSVPDHADWNLGTGDFTVDFWVMFNSTSTQTGLFGQYQDDTNHLSVYFGGSPIDALNFRFRDASTYRADYSLAWTPSVNTWYHLAFVRNGTNFYIFKDGVSQSLSVSTAISTNTLGDLSGTFDVGRSLQPTVGQRYLNGWMDEFRVSKGVARWTTDFTLDPINYSSDSYTKLLLHLDDNLTDSGNTTHTVTLNYSTSSYAFRQAKFDDSALFLDGTGDCIQVEDSNDWNFGTGDFTIDFWFYQSSDAEADLIGQANASGYAPYRVLISGAGAGVRELVVYFSSNGSSWDITSGLSGGQKDWSGQWYHVCVVRSSTNFYLFINGALVDSDTSSAALQDSSEVLYIGSFRNSTRWFNGHLDELRISKGIARWTGAFTVPTSPYNGSCSQIAITGLDGNTDDEYLLVARLVNGYSGSNYYAVRLNNDSESKYGHQYLGAGSTTVYVARSISESTIYLGQGAALNDIDYTVAQLLVKSGKPRTCIVQQTRDISGATINYIYDFGYVYSDQVTNIRSLMLYTQQVNGFGPGTNIVLYKKSKKV